MNNVKKTVVKIVVLLLVFFAALILGSRIMNQGHNNLTMEMAEAGLPVVSMELNGDAYNLLFGHQKPGDTAFWRDTVTVLDENRETAMIVDPCGREVTGISMEVRSVDGSRLIEDTPVTDYSVKGGKIQARVALKDLIEMGKEYSLTILLELDGEQQIRYYTRVIWDEELYAAEKMAFVRDFHEKLYDREAARELTRYLETDPGLEDNRTFHKVNIHSSFQQITWGDLHVKEERAPIVQLKEIADQTAAFLLDYVVSTAEGKQPVYYRVKEYYRVRYTSERMYLLDFERTMDQISDVESMYSNDKILLGITDENVPMAESEDGNTVVFEQAGRLLSYNASTNRLAVIFSFYDENHCDVRDMNDQHGIKILDVNEAGNVKFALYGYMNRGRHEGETGLQIYTYDSTLNTLEEEVYLPYSKSYAVLKEEMDQLLYLNREEQLYVFLENIVYEINLTDKTYRKMVQIACDDSLKVSENNKMIVWQEGEDIYDCQELQVRNLGNGTQQKITVGKDESIRPLGFMGEDIIYGVARKQDAVKESFGTVFFPMYKLCISDSDGNLLKEYEENNIYITECTVENNQITLERMVKKEDGTFEETAPDHITDNTETSEGKNQIVAADIDVYQRYVQIQTQNTIDSKTIKILTPKEVVFEGGRTLELNEESDTERYYVYDAYGVNRICSMPSKAVELADQTAGTVVDGSGRILWQKKNRVARNQIMAIRERRMKEGENSLSVCLDTILSYEGTAGNSREMLLNGFSVLEILESNLEEVRALDLTGCSLDSVLYYVNQDIPVLAILENGDAVLITGFNEFNIVIMDPAAGTLEKKGINDSAQWFAENGNRFITYLPGE